VPFGSGRRPPARFARLFQYVPALDSLRDYSWAALNADLMAGLTVATVAVPQAMAYATLAGLPPQYGLYTAIVMTAVGALLDSSRQLINGPTNAISIALLSALAIFPEEHRLSAAVLLAFMVGVTQTGIALLHLGDLTRYVSHSVIVGFTFGAGALLVLDQMGNLLGLTGHGRPEDHFLKRFWLTMTEGGGIRWPTFLIGVGTIVIVLLVRQFNGYRRKRGARFPIPQHLVAVIMMATVVWGFDLADTGHGRGVKIVGNIPAQLPQFQIPPIKPDWVRLLAGDALAVAVLGLLEAIAMAKAIARRTGQRLDINQQCLSEGAANLAGSFFQCFPGSGSLTRSAVNQQAGAVSQWSGVFAAIAVAAMVLVFAPLARYIPRSALAGLLMLAAFRMVDFEQLRFNFWATKFDAGVIVATALAAVVISVEFCILIGVFLSFVLYVPRAAQVRLIQLTPTRGGRLREHQPGDPPCGRLLIYNLEGELFFGTEPELEKHFATITDAAQEKVRVVLLILKRARNPDAAFLSALRALHARLRQQEVTLMLCGLTPPVLAGIKGTGLDAEIGVENLYLDQPTPDGGLHDPVQAAYRILGEELCASCPRRDGARTYAPDDYII
jgi:SulP family sulfate permease